MTYRLSPYEKFINFIYPILANLRLKPKLFSSALVESLFFIGNNSKNKLNHASNISTLPCMYLPPQYTCSITNTTNLHKYERRWVQIGTNNFSMSSVKIIKPLASTPEQLLKLHPEYFI